MKTIAKYIDGYENDDVVPSIAGKIVKVVPIGEGVKNQRITVKDSEGEKINIQLRPDVALDEAEAGMLFYATSSGGKEASVGITLKEKEDGTKYLVIRNGASVRVEEEGSVTETSKPKEGQKRKSTSQLTIESYVLDRLFIYREVNSVISEFNDAYPDFKYPLDKASELATSVHIEIAKKGIAPRGDSDLADLGSGSEGSAKGASKSR